MVAANRKPQRVFSRRGLSHTCSGLCLVFQNDFIWTQVLAWPVPVPSDVQLYRIAAWLLWCLRANVHVWPSWSVVTSSFFVVLAYAGGASGGVSGAVGGLAQL